MESLNFEAEDGEDEETWESVGLPCLLEEPACFAAWVLNVVWCEETEIIDYCIDV